MIGKLRLTKFKTLNQKRLNAAYGPAAVKRPVILAWVQQVRANRKALGPELQNSKQRRCTRCGEAYRGAPKFPAVEGNVLSNTMAITANVRGPTHNASNQTRTIRLCRACSRVATDMLMEWGMTPLKKQHEVPPGQPKLKHIIDEGEVGELEIEGLVDGTIDLGEVDFFNAACSVRGCQREHGPDSDLCRDHQRLRRQPGCPHLTEDLPSIK